MADMTPIAVASKRAARLLDMSEKEFLGHVQAGHLPQPIRICGNDRWRVADIDAIVSGSAARPEEDGFEI